MKIITPKIVQEIQQKKDKHSEELVINNIT